MTIFLTHSITGTNSPLATSTARALSSLSIGNVSLLRNLCEIKEYLAPENKILADNSFTRKVLEVISTSSLAASSVFWNALALGLGGTLGF